MNQRRSYAAYLVHIVSCRIGGRRLKGIEDPDVSVAPPCEVKGGGRTHRPRPSDDENTSILGYHFDIGADGLVYASLCLEAVDLVKAPGIRRGPKHRTCAPGIPLRFGKPFPARFPEQLRVHRNCFPALPCLPRMTLRSYILRNR